MSPGQYIVKVDRATGEPLSDPIEPHELLVHAHRDRHPIEISAQFLASRLIHLTGNEGLVKLGLKGVERLGSTVGRTVAGVTGNPDDARRVARLLGVTTRDYGFQFREPTHLSEREVKARVADLQKQAKAKLEALGKRPRLRVLLTGATGFLGKEFLAQAAAHPYVDEVVCVVRPEKVRDRRTKEVLKVLSARERGALLLKRLHLTGKAAARFRFVEGDVEQPGFGIEAAELSRLRRELTHVVHCAASVSFDDPYESSFRANVLGCRNALAFSKQVQAAAGSRFVAHVAIETSYIHGRRKRSIAQEHALVFPRHFYNNYYELTKAMASIETDRALVQDGLRVTQLLPSIVIGHARRRRCRSSGASPSTGCGRCWRRASRRASRRTARRRSTSFRWTAWRPGSWRRSRRPRRSARASTSRRTTASARRRSAGSPRRSWACACGSPTRRCPAT
jgi:nucleoside-diphosphate-sugar epimerase